jgi:hypothetical protein
MMEGIKEAGNIQVSVRSAPPSIRSATEDLSQKDNSNFVAESALTFLEEQGAAVFQVSMLAAFVSRVKEQNTAFPLITSMVRQRRILRSYIGRTMWASLTLYTPPPKMLPLVK